MDQENEIRFLKSFVAEFLDFIEHPDRTDQAWKDSIIKAAKEAGYAYNLNVNSNEYLQAKVSNAVTLATERIRQKAKK